MYAVAISVACPSGEEGVFYSLKRFLPAFAALTGRGEGLVPFVQNSPGNEDDASIPSWYITIQFRILKNFFFL
jgi:hypothetical protein